MWVRIGIPISTYSEKSAANYHEWRRECAGGDKDSLLHFTVRFLLQCWKILNLRRDAVREWPKDSGINNHQQVTWYGRRTNWWCRPGMMFLHLLPPHWLYGLQWWTAVDWAGECAVILLVMGDFNGNWSYTLSPGPYWILLLFLFKF